MPAHIYIIAAPSDRGAFTSLERDPSDARKVRAYATCADAVRAESCGDPFVPGYLIGEDPPERMADLSPRELSLALNAIDEVAKLVEVRHHYDPTYGEDFWMWARGSNYWFEELSADALAKLLALFPKRNDSRVTGRRDVLRVEVE